MSHLHVPDGILPVWLWIAGWLLALGWVALICMISRKRSDILRKVPLVAISAALMVVAMTCEIAPLDYHLNLSVITGILLGPFLAPIAALITETVLALMGHGGVTVIGLNTLILSAEMILGWLFFFGLRRLLRRSNRKKLVVGFSGALSTVLALAIATTFTVGVVSFAGPKLSEQMHEHESHGFLSPPSVAHEEHEEEAAHGGEENSTLSLTAFVAIVYTLGPIGWALETSITTIALIYIQRLRPSLLLWIPDKQKSSSTTSPIAPPIQVEQGGDAA